MAVSKSYDRITLDASKAVMLPNGMMRLPGRLSRVGLQEYWIDGRKQVAFRPPEEVGAAESLASFELMPLTDEHPPKGEVTADNARELSRGSVGAATFDGQFVTAPVLVSDANLIKSIKAGKVELSVGYAIEFDATPGEYKGQHYDFVQRKIRANHVAVVDQGRAGPDVRLMLDTAVSTEIQTTNVAPQRKTTVIKIMIDGYEVEVSEVAAKAIAKERAMAEGLLKTAHADLEAAKKELTEKTAMADAAQSQVAKLEAEIKAAPAKYAEAAKARLALELKAKEHGVACDGLDDAAVKAAVIAKLSPEVDLKGKDAVYVSVMFDAALAFASRQNPATQRVADDLKGSAPKPAEGSAKEAKAKMNDSFFNPEKK